MGNITTVILTSPIPSHPSLDILNETIFGTREYTDSPILILFDGVHSSLAHREDNYNKYKSEAINNIKSGTYGDCSYCEFKNHSHQSEMMRYALKELIKTPLILFNEHDTKMINDIPFKEICDLVEKSKLINYIKFNIFNKIPEEHKYLVLGETEFGNIKLTHTIQFSARPHIAKTDWYRNIIESYFNEGYKGMVEDVMHSVVQESYKHLGHDIFGLFIYTPDGNQLRSYHSNGRGNDEKIIDA